MYINVNYIGGTNFGFNVDNDVTTVAQLKQAIAARIGVGAERINLSYRSKPFLRDELLLSELGIGDLSLVEIKVQQQGRRPYDMPEASRLMGELLQHLLGKEERKILFIGIASYDNGVHEEGSVERQQCPEDIFNFCILNGVNLYILLIDPDFAAESRIPEQIFHRSGWEAGREGEGYRCYRYATLRAEVKLWTFHMYVEKDFYDGNTTILDKFDLVQFKESLERHGGCLICGNFYESTHKANLVIGDNATMGKIPWLTSRMPEGLQHAFNSNNDSIPTAERPSRWVRSGSFQGSTGMQPMRPRGGSFSGNSGMEEVPMPPPASAQQGRPSLQRRRSSPSCCKCNCTIQ